MADLIWSTYRFYAAGIAVAIIGLVWLLIEKTPFGATVKAGAHDSEIVRALGINLTRLRLLVFVFGTMLAAIAGIIVAPIWGIRPHMGVDAVIPAFLVIVLGGVGSFWGAVLRACWSASPSASPAPMPPNGRCCRCTCCWWRS